MRYELYYAAEDVMPLPVNADFDSFRVLALLELLKKEQRASFNVIDVSRLSRAELSRAYDAAVIPSTWKRYRIRKVFGTQSSSGTFFGRGVPALLVYEGERPIDVFPHEVAGEAVTIRAYLEGLCGERSKGAGLANRMDELRKAMGPVGAATSELVHEGRRR